MSGVLWLVAALLLLQSQDGPRPGQCLVPDSLTYARLHALGTRLAVDRARNHGDPPFDIRTVTVERTEAVCMIAARQYEWMTRQHGQRRPPDPATDRSPPRYAVVLLRLGLRGYLVHAPSDTVRQSGCRNNIVQLDSAFRPQAGLCDPWSGVSRPHKRAQ